MRIGDTVFVHGIVDEIRKDTVIIRNNGGYFGTVAGEIITGDMTGRKKGKWQITDAYPHNVYCSECHTRFAQTHWAVWEDGSLPRNFCPNCGSYNGGENDQSK